MTAPIVVIGGGLAGLTASYELAQAGQAVLLLESAPVCGGLASSFSLRGYPVEQFYHFVCRSDQALVDLISELGLAARLHWQQSLTSFYYYGHLYPFGTPLDLVRFAPVPWLQRFRFGVHILRSRYRLVWRWLDQIPARPWLIENIGEQAYQVIWHPLLRIKFGDAYDRISAAWVWHRIWRVARSRQRLWEHEAFGYLDNGSFTLVEGLVERLKTYPQVTVCTHTPCRKIEIENGRVCAIWTDAERIPCQAVLSTVALPVLQQLLATCSTPALENCRQIEYIGVVCALLNLDRPFSKYFWMNINDPAISFNGIIELTNLNRAWRQAGLNLVYIPYYLPTTHPRYSWSDEDLMHEYLDMLRQVNPAFQPSWVKEWHIFRSPYAQAICTTGFSELVPPVRMDLPGLYLTDSTQFYPEDRTLSAATQQGRLAARTMLADLI